MLLTPPSFICFPLKSTAVAKSSQVDQAGQGSTKTREITPYVPSRLRYENEGSGGRRCGSLRYLGQLCYANYVIGRNSDNNKLDYATGAN